MGTRWPETCWANYKTEINIILKVTSSWSLYPHWTTMHGQQYIKIIQKYLTNWTWSPRTTEIMWMLVTVAVVCHRCVHMQESNAVYKEGLQRCKLIDVKIMWAPGATRHHANTEGQGTKNSNSFEREGDKISALSGYGSGSFATSVAQSEK